MKCRAFPFRFTRSLSLPFVKFLPLPSFAYCVLLSRKVLLFREDFFEPAFQGLAFQFVLGFWLRLCRAKFSVLSVAVPPAQNWNNRGANWFR